MWDSIRRAIASCLNIALSPPLCVACMFSVFQGLVGKYIDGDGDGARGVKRKAVVSAATTISSSGSTSTRTSSPAVGAKGGSAAQAKSEPPGAVAMGSKPAASAEPTKLVR